VGTHGIGRVVGAREVVDGGEVAGARLAATEGVGELGGGTGAVERFLLRRDFEDVELPRFVERERRDEAGEVVVESGRARQHRLERELAGRVGVVAGDHVAEVMGDELRATTALFAGEREAVAVAELLGTEPLTGKAASKDAVVRTMREAGVIHLATHGILEDVRGQGTPGALALGAFGNDDGFLTTPEIMDLRLKAGTAGEPAVQWAIHRT